MRSQVRWLYGLFKINSNIIRNARYFDIIHFFFFKSTPGSMCGALIIANIANHVDIDRIYVGTDEN